MTPRTFLKKYQYDGRLVTGEYFSSEPLPVEPGDLVGVVMFYSGGPFKSSEVAPFLYRWLMDPAAMDFPPGKFFREGFSRVLAAMLAPSVSRQYDAIGGRSPLNELASEQARALTSVLNEQYGRQVGATFQTYMASRYWHPTFEEAARRMAQDGVNKVVLLPLYPQYSKTTSGSAFLYWWALRQSGEIPDWPTVFVYEYAAHPKYIQAVSERIDEALQRFQRKDREEVQFLFSAQGTPLRDMTQRRDPYCCLIHSTVEQVMAYRGEDRPYHVAFQSNFALADWLTPGTREKLQDLARAGKASVLLVPVSFVTDHFETAYHLDVKLRGEAERMGLLRYEVTSGLNCHPLFIKALGEVTAAHLRPGMQEDALWHDAVPAYASCPLNHRHREVSRERETRCRECPAVVEAGRWRPPVNATVAPSPGRHARSA